jgi:pimeloyl-ACP methyl ester carboxylesterase
MLLHLADEGSGAPVFLIHAFPLDHTMWGAQTGRLAPGYRILAPDLPGFGATERHPHWRIADVAESILAIADERKIPAFALVGLSMGAYTAFEVVDRAPDRIRCLVLANCRARADSPEERDTRTALIARVESEGTVILDETILPRLLGPDPDPRIRDQVSKIMARQTKEAVTDALEALRERRDSTGLLETIPCPTLVVAGTRDRLTPPDEMKAMSDRIPGARFTKIPDAGHLSNLENPSAFNRALEGFLDAYNREP